MEGGVAGECATFVEDGLGEGCSFDQVHDEVGGTVFVRDDVADRNDSGGVLEVGEGLSFLDELVAKVRVEVAVGGVYRDGCVGVGDPVFWVILFDGNRFVEEGVVGSVGDTEATLPQESVDTVVVVAEERSWGESCHCGCFVLGGFR